MRYTLKSPVDVYLSLCCEEDYPRNPEAAKRWHVARNRGETWIMDENGDTVASVEREDAANLIAAAPTLLAACETIAQKLEQWAERLTNVHALMGQELHEEARRLRTVAREAKGGE